MQVKTQAQTQGSCVCVVLRENAAQHNHKALTACYVRPIEALVPDFTRVRAPVC